MLLVVFELLHCGVVASSRNVVNLPHARATSVQHRQGTLGPRLVPRADGRTALMRAGCCRRTSCVSPLTTIYWLEILNSNSVRNVVGQLLRRQLQLTRAPEK